METACVEISGGIDASSIESAAAADWTAARTTGWVGAGKSGGRDSKKGVLTVRLFLCDFFVIPIVTESAVLELPLRDVHVTGWSWLQHP